MIKTWQDISVYKSIPLTEQYNIKIKSLVEKDLEEQINIFKKGIISKDTKQANIYV